jgi:hypothetical protein
MCASLSSKKFGFVIATIRMPYQIQLAFLLARHTMHASSLVVPTAFQVTMVKASMI